MNPKLDISSDSLQKLYLQEGKTIDEIAFSLGCSPTTVRRRLIEYSIHRHPHGPRDKNVAPGWSSKLAYSVGLLATDGNLSKDGRHITLTSSDQELLEIFNQCVEANLRICLLSNTSKNCYRIQWSNRPFYHWLVNIGMMPDKSSRLGPIIVPREYYPDFVRGCLDGDGNINVYLDRNNSYKDRTYIYTRLCVRFTSASLHFLEWLQTIIYKSIEVKGGIYEKKSRKAHQSTWDLKYAKKESISLLRWIYYSPNVPHLSRKYNRALLFLG